MYQGQTMTVRNDSPKQVSATYDSKTYVFEPGADITLPIDIARMLQGRAPELVEVSVQKGAVGEEHEFAIVENISEETVTAAFDGVPYTFAPGDKVKVPKEIVSWLTDRPHVEGRLHVLPEAAVAAEAEAPVAAEPTPEAEPEAPQPKKKAKKTQSA